MAASPVVRLLTLNIAHGRGLSTYQGFHSARGIERNLNRIAHLLKKTSPHVVAMQEVDEDSHWNKGIHLLNSLQEKSGYPHGYLGVHNKRGGRLPLAYGNGMLTRLPIEYAEHQAFGQASLGEKGFMYAELALPQGHLPVVNLHLDFRSRRRRVRQIERLIDYLDERADMASNGPFLHPVICGDFNAREGRPSDAVRHLFRYLQERCAYQLYPQGKCRTFPALLPTRGIDFFFIPPAYRVRHCEVLRAYVSDHRPILIELEAMD